MSPKNLERLISIEYDFFPHVRAFFLVKPPPISSVGFSNISI